MYKFLIVDSARCGFDRIEEMKTLSKEEPGIVFLLSEKESYMEIVAPHLFRVENNIREWFFENGWNKSWGIFIDTSASFADCVAHFQKISIKNEGGQSRYFRFYDPRVIKVFLSGCDKQQIIEFFGPIEKFIVEGDTKEEAIEFTHKNGILNQRKIPASEIFGEGVQATEKV